MYIRLSVRYVFIETYKLVCRSTPLVWCINNHIKLSATPTVWFPANKTFLKGSENHVKFCEKRKTNFAKNYKNFHIKMFSEKMQNFSETNKAKIR